MYPAPHNTGLRRSNDRFLAGVCSGWANFLGIDPTLVRVVWILFTLLGGAGLLLYLVCWALMPDAFGRRAVTPVIAILMLFVAFPALCFLLTLPFRIIF